MASGPYDIAIIGCGTAGPAAALFLARDGHRVRIFERAPALGPVGAGLLIQPTGQRVLERLGLLERIRSYGDIVNELHAATRSGRVVLDLHYDELEPELHGLGLHRAVLLDVLVSAVRAASIPLELGREIEAIERLPTGRLTLLDRAGVREGPFDLVVLCDGSRSALRARHGGLRRARPYPWGALWFIAPDRNDRFRRRLSQVLDGTQRMVGFLPTGLALDGDTELVSMFWSIRNDAIDAWRARGLDALKAEILAMEPRAAEILEQLTDFKMLTHATYMDVSAAAHPEPGIATIGDSAHAMSPQLGQGANLALIDAETLADVLREVASLEAGLDEYARRRKASLAFYQLANRVATPFFQSSLPLLGWLRDLFFGLLGRFGPMRRQMLLTMAGVKRGILRRSLPIPKLPPHGADPVAAAQRRGAPPKV